MFQDRIKRLEARLLFPSPDAFDHDAYSLEFLRSREKRYELYWNPTYLSFSPASLRSMWYRPIRHLFLFRFTTATASFIRHQEFEELY